MIRNNMQKNTERSFNLWNPSDIRRIPNKIQSYQSYIIHYLSILDLELQPVELPGRENRIRESLISDFNQLVEDALVIAQYEINYWERKKSVVEYIKKLVS